MKLKILCNGMHILLNLVGFLFCFFAICKGIQSDLSDEDMKEPFRIDFSFSVIEETQNTPIQNICDV